MEETIEQNHKPRRKPKSGRLFEFTEQDELCIKRAIRLSKRFMAKFGKGVKHPKIDRRHYF